MSPGFRAVSLLYRGRWWWRDGVRIRRAGRQERDLDQRDAEPQERTASRSYRGFGNWRRLRRHRRRPRHSRARTHRRRSMRPAVLGEIGPPPRPQPVQETLTRDKPHKPRVKPTGRSSTRDTPTTVIWSSGIISEPGRHPARTVSHLPGESTERSPMSSSPHPKTVVIIGALDTKGAEFAYLKGLIETEGVDTLVVDFGDDGGARTGAPCHESRGRSGGRRRHLLSRLGRAQGRGDGDHGKGPRGRRPPVVRRGAPRRDHRHGRHRRHLHRPPRGCGSCPWVCPR